MLDVRLYFLQRLTAIVMAPLVLGHLAVMIYAVHGGVSAAEILSRTQGSFLWAGFYGLFVLAVAVHAAIGLRVIVFEITGLNRRLLGVFTGLVFAGLLWLGARAVIAVTFG
ncbi:MAG: succinate dehydrogenase [Burkholderiaceae bacterium]